ncbi:hypothetical protein EJK55_0381 [Moraxella catarrhalis]|uniref:Uncharacterized protein n=1 Tax=Moraxella catarrhalis TaxID=480 RepID=A0ABY0BID4_MORCA|nr:hypothetical protein EJK54_0324 [Moraxella catarrhalis]RUO15323.1 hypothetical protein EJK55_0381 [Moraxella catarrhalis]
MTHQSSKQACKILGINFGFYFGMAVYAFIQIKTVQSVLIERFL